LSPTLQGRPSEMPQLETWRRFSQRSKLHDARGAVATVQALLANLSEPGGDHAPDGADGLGAIALEIAHLARLLDRELDRSEPDSCDLATIAQDVIRAHQLAYEMTVLWRGRPTEVLASETTVWRVLTVSACPYRHAGCLQSHRSSIV